MFSIYHRALPPPRCTLVRMSAPSAALPPATFEFLVLSLRAQAEMFLGLLPTLEGGEEKPDLPMAKHAIDLLAVLAEKTRGNLALDEQRLVDNSLTELRFRYVEALSKAT